MDALYCVIKLKYRGLVKTKARRTLNETKVHLYNKRKVNKASNAHQRTLTIISAA